MTKAMVASLRWCSAHEPIGWPLDSVDVDPSLEDPTVGRPISHSQVIALSRILRDYLRKRSLAPSVGGDSTSTELSSRATDDEVEHPPFAHMDELLRGTSVYIEPRPPKSEPTSEYKALMARLRREEEERAYERMINPLLPSQIFAPRFQSPLETRAAHSQEQEDEDEATYADINRQMALIINVLVSIICCAVAIWMVASHWSAGTRLALSMSGSGLVGVAEVVIYAGYIRRVKESKQKEKKKVEKKEIVETWVIERAEETDVVEAKENYSHAGESVGDLRRRKGNGQT